MRGERGGAIRRALLRVMYERGSTNHLPDPELSAAPSPPAETPPPVLREPTEEEILEGVMCRFCFDSSSDEGRLIAPCACSGSQTWVHEVCLRKWQKAKAYSSRGGPRHDAVCNVCMTPFALPPPPPPPLPTVRAGSFLVAAPSLSGIFHQTVILMCEVPDFDRTHKPWAPSCSPARSPMQSSCSPARAPV